MRQLHHQARQTVLSELFSHVAFAENRAEQPGKKDNTNAIQKASNLDGSTIDNKRYF